MSLDRRDHRREEAGDLSGRSNKASTFSIRQRKVFFSTWCTSLPGAMARHMVFAPDRCQVHDPEAETKYQCAGCRCEARQPTDLEKSAACAEFLLPQMTLHSTLGATCPLSGPLNEAVNLIRFWMECCFSRGSGCYWHAVCPA